MTSSKRFASTCFTSSPFNSLNVRIAGNGIRLRVYLHMQFGIGLGKHLHQALRSAGAGVAGTVAALSSHGREDCAIVRATQRFIAHDLSEKDRHRISRICRNAELDGSPGAMRVDLLMNQL